MRGSGGARAAGGVSERMPRGGRWCVGGRERKEEACRGALETHEDAIAREMSSR